MNKKQTVVLFFAQNEIYEGSGDSESVLLHFDHTDSNLREANPALGARQGKLGSQ